MSIAEHSSLPAGKLPLTLLAQLLADLPTADPHLLVGPAVGQDAAIIDFGAADRLLIAKSDPITFATDEIGYYAVNVCANDIAVMGGVPRFYLPTLLLPAGQTDAALVQRIFRQLGDACRALGIVIAGGHSEITPTVAQPVIAGTMLGEVARGAYLTTQGCRPGDVLLVAGALPVEGASLIAREKRVELLARGWSPADLDRAAAYLHDPGISVQTPARLAVQAGGVTAMHDPTEGGIATGLLELAHAAGVGLDLNLDAIVIPDLARRLCAEFGLDPLGVIASGALLVACSPDAVSGILAAWAAHGWPGAIIGHATTRGGPILAHRGGVPGPLPAFPADEITKLWG